MERAIDWVFSHAEELDSMETEDAGPSQQYRDGPASEYGWARETSKGMARRCGNVTLGVSAGATWDRL